MKKRKNFKNNYQLFASKVEMKPIYRLMMKINLLLTKTRMKIHLIMNIYKMNKFNRLKAGFLQKEKHQTTLWKNILKFKVLL